MRKPFVPILVAAILLLAGLSGWLLLQNRDAGARYRELSAAETASRDSYNRTLDAIAEIQDSLDAIVPRDGSFQPVTGSLATEQEMAGPDGRRALERIATLRASIERSRDRIEKLQGDLHRTGVHVSSLKRMVANLNRTLDERQKALDEMSAQVQQLQGTVSTLETAVQDSRDTLLVRDATLEEKRHELATVYCLVGTRQELAKQGAIVATGGFLGLGKTLQPTGHLPEGASLQLDTDVSTVLPVNAAKARVLTPQPASSYEMKMVDGRMELHILDPEAFRTVRQLVIVTA